MRFPTGGELVIECLVRQGVSHVFSIIGGQMGSMYDAIGLSPDIEVVTPRNETAGALMACGYTATSGRPCVSMATVGAGVVYEVAGLSKAWFDYLPVVSIAPQVQSYRVKPHQESLQACNQDEIFYPVTKWNSIIFHWDRIPQMVDRAFREALNGIPGPTHLDIPVDVLFKRGLLSEKSERTLMPPPATTRYDGPIRGEEQKIKKAAEALAASSRPLALLGQGMGRPGRYPEVSALLEGLGVPVLTTTSSSGVMPAESCCYAGDLAMMAGPGGDFDTLASADLLLLVGVDHYSREFLSRVSPRPVVIQVEKDQRAFLSNLPGHQALCADPTSALLGIRDECKVEFISWCDKVLASAHEVERRNVAGDELVGRILATLKGLANPATIIVADGQAATVASECMSCGGTEYKGLYIMDGRQIRGAGLPYAMGAAIANPDSEVLLVTDKDSLFYHVGELQPACSEGIGIKLVVVDDGSPSLNVADASSVVEALGCTIETSVEDISTASGERQPAAFMIR